MKQKKLAFSDPRKQKTDKHQYATLDLLCHSVYVCDSTFRILFCNRFAQSAFPMIRTGMLFTRFCQAPLSDDSLVICPIMGFHRYLLCTHPAPDRFEIQIPGGLVATKERMEENASQVRALLESTRLVLERLSHLPPKHRRPAPQEPSLGDLGELLSKCLADLESGPPVSPRLTVSVQDLLQAVRRRSAHSLQQSDACFDFDCPPHLLCSARIGPTVFILLNLICFFRICIGQKEISLRVREEGKKILFQLSAPTLLSPAPFFATLFCRHSETALREALLATPFALAAATAAKEGFSLSCHFPQKGIRICLALPLLKGTPDLTVIDAEALEQALFFAGISRLSDSLLALFS